LKTRRWSYLMSHVVTSDVLISWSWSEIQSRRSIISDHEKRVSETRRRQDWGTRGRGVTVIWRRCERRLSNRVVACRPVGTRSGDSTKSWNDAKSDFLFRLGKCPCVGTGVIPFTWDFPSTYFMISQYSRLLSCQACFQILWSANRGNCVRKEKENSMLQLGGIDFIVPMNLQWIKIFNATFGFHRLTSLWLEWEECYLRNMMLNPWRDVVYHEKMSMKACAVDKCFMQATHGNRDIIKVHNLPLCKKYEYVSLPVFQKLS